MEKRCEYTTIFFFITIVMLSGCSTKKNTASSRWWHSFNARYNTYFNGSQAFIEGSIEKENGNKDNYTEMIPLYAVANKNSKDIGKANFDRAIEKSEKAIKLHSIKRRPQWTKDRRKTAKDIEWLNRREYNPFLWKAWLLLGKAQFQQGNFEEAAATFAYMSRLYNTQPAINGIARAWLTKAYTEQGWLYEAEDVITKMRRDSMDYRAVTDWDYAYADYYIRSKQYPEAVAYLRKVIRHERRKKLRARQWYLMGQLQAEMGNTALAYKAFKRVTRLNPPYELAFNARIAQTEVMARGRSRQMVRKLRRMAASDNNKEYLDQVYYAMGNIYMNERDTANAIAAYEKGNKLSTHNGIEKGTLLLKLGNIYWQQEHYNDAQRCYGEAIGLLDKDRDYYEELSERSKILDELVPHTDAVHLQDSLQALATMSEDERNKAIDRVIAEAKRQAEEAKRQAEEAEAERIAQEQGAVGNRNAVSTTTTTTQSSTWYFYNPTAVSQGKAQFQRQWGKRENVDNWQRVNKTVVGLSEEREASFSEERGVRSEELLADEDSTLLTPHSSLHTENEESSPLTREYYLAQIPFTPEQKAESDNTIKGGLLSSGIIFKDKMDNLQLSERNLTRLTTQYANYEKNDEALYHLFLLYSRQGRHDKAQACLGRLEANHPESQWTTLLADPYYADNARFGEHMEDSIYAATYDAFKANRASEVKANTIISAERFPLGANRAKFLFIGGLSLLNNNDPRGCLEAMREVVEKHPQSEVAEMAGMIIKGVQAGRPIHGGNFDLDDMWSRRTADLGLDSTTVDTLSTERNTSYLFILAYNPDSVSSNKLLFEVAKYNFTNYMVRNFDISIDNNGGISRMTVSGFLSYDEALQYARSLYADKTMAAQLDGCRRIIVSTDNLPLLGTKFSYADYEKFFGKELAPIKISEERLLDNPETIEQQETPAEEQESQEEDDDDLFNTEQPADDGVVFDFDEDFYR